MRKNILPRYKIIDAVTMGGNITSSVTQIQYFDNIAIQINWTTANAVGTFNIEGSADYAIDNMGNVTNTGNWIAIPSLAQAAGGASNTVLIDMTSVGFPYIRIKYTRTSGTGTATAYISAKQAGG